jgi:hypothetical protein
MTYTREWNHEFVKNTKSINLNNQNLCLEIGSFEGLTSNYIVDNILSANGKLICVDPLTDNYLVEIHLLPLDGPLFCSYRII